MTADYDLSPAQELDVLRRLHALGRLTESSAKFASPMSIAESAAALLGAKHCAIMLHLGIATKSPKTMLWAHSVGWPVEMCDARFESDLLQSVSRGNERPQVVRNPEGDNMFCVCFDIDDGTVGTLNCYFPGSVSKVSELREATASVMVAILAKYIAYERLKGKLHSQMIKLTAVDACGRYAQSQEDWNRRAESAAKILAKSFYKNLRASGFEPVEIIDVATSIISHISTDIARHKRRLER